MSSNEVRRGVTQASFNESAAWMVQLEVLAVGALGGLAAQSWWVFGGIFFGAAMCFAFRPLAFLLIALFTAAWTCFGWGVGEAIGKSGAPTVLAVLCGLISLGAHIGCLQWSRDLQRR